MWGENVDDVNFDSRVFPRTLAVAERLWSAESVNVVDMTTAMRLEEMRCHIVRRGVGAGPIIPSYCAAAYGWF